MDVHRGRFVRFPASPVNALALSRSDDKGFDSLKPALKLAIGRADGSIEIWNSERGNWVQETVFPGAEGSSIDALLWTQEPNETDPAGKPILGQLRLFSIGGSEPSVAEWNLATGLQLRTATGNFAQVWCFAAQPRWLSSKRDSAAKAPAWQGQDIVAGCGDGSLAILTTADDDLAFKRFLTRSGSRKTRCMSVTWQNRETVVAGFSDGNIRIYDTRSGSLIRTMSLGAGIPGAPKDILVWKVKCLPAGDIVSADSNGELRFWDGRTYSMTQRLQGHDSDCLDLVVSADGYTVFSSGIDGRIAVYKFNHRGGDGRRWAKLSHRRLHDGDIKTMAGFDSKQMSVVISGGNDTIPIAIPFREYGKENPRRLPGLPQKQPCVSAPSARLLFSWWERVVSIWKIGPHENVPSGASNRPRVLQLGIRGVANISSVAVSPDAKFLAVATSAQTQLYQLRKSKHCDDLRPRLVKLPKDVTASGSRHVAISPDGRWLAAVSLNNELRVLRIVYDGVALGLVLPEVTELESLSRPATRQTGLKSYDQTINHVVFSPDSTTLVTSDLSGHIDAFTLSGSFDPSAEAAIRVPNQASKSRPTSTSDLHSDSDDSDDDDDLPVSYYSQIWAQHPLASRLPRLDSPALLVTFHPTPRPSSLLLTLSQRHQLHEFDLSTCRLSPWSRRNPTGTLPAEFRGIKDRVMGCVWDHPVPSPSPAAAAADDRQHRLWLFGPSFLAMLDVRRDFADPGAGGKRKRPEDEKLALRRGGARARKGVSGAGDAVGALEAAGLDVGGGAGEDEDMVDVEDGEEDEEDEDEDEDEDEAAADGAVVGRDADGSGRKWWCTFKYRPILGLVPVERRGAGGDEEGRREESELEWGGLEPRELEIVVVERPVWELEHMKEAAAADAAA